MLQQVSRDIAILFVVLGALVPNLQGQKEESPRFETDVLSLFQTKCWTCHGEALKQKGLDLRTRDSLLKGGETGPGIVPGSAKESLLFKKVSTGEMPLGGTKLSTEEIGLIQRWIDAGALKEGEDAETAKSQLKAKQVTEQEIMVNIFRSKCITCHGKWRQEGGLDLRTRESLLKGGRSGAVIRPGRPEESLVLKRIVAGEMPPRKDIYGDTQYVRRVSSEEIEKLRRWIASGALATEEVALDPVNGPDLLVKSEDRKFWSFQPAKRPPIPTVAHTSMVRTPLDAFLLQKLEEKGLSFSPEQGRLALMRRAYFDLIGMPPDPAEVQAYANDQRPDSYERLIDRLLASPLYGERWGKYWLDAAGYADSHGKIDPDRLRPHAWRYRDYVIRSLNQDKPYNRFLLEQIAGDELFDYTSVKDPTPKQLDWLVATGFLRTAADDTDEGAQNFVPYRMAVLFDQINIFSSAVMGLTMECARCHSHKYDPIPQRDYYRMIAIFQSAYDPYDWRIPSSALYAGGKVLDLPESYQRFLALAPGRESLEVDKHNAPIREQIKRLENSLDVKMQPLRERLIEEKLSKFPDVLRSDLRKVLETPEQKRTAVQKYLQEQFGASLHAEPEEIEERFTDFKEYSSKIQKSIQETRAKLEPEPMIQALFDMGGEPSPAYLARRGDAGVPGVRVLPGVPSVLGEGIAPYKLLRPAWKTGTSGQRLALAQWLIQPNHPLTARVMVNRIWQHHFGTGLVVTPGNFGKIGARPSNPALLDWMSTEFVRRGWSLKEMHKLIMISAVYRQSSLLDSSAQRADPDNVLLSRFPLQRLDAEALRDSVLKVSGRLDTRQFGPADEVDVAASGEVVTKGEKSSLRRSIYLLQRRSTPVTMLEIFDAPRMNPNCLLRSESTVATQALQLWNSELVRETSRYFAGRIMEAAGDDVTKQVERVYLAALSRHPTAEERVQGTQAVSDLTRYWLEHLQKEVPAEPKANKAHWLALATFCHVILNSPEFIYID